MAVATVASSTVAPPRPLLPSLASCRRAPLSRWSACASTSSRGGAPAAAASSLLDATVVAGRRGVREYVEAAREMARRPDGRPPRWFSPLECGGAGAGGRVPGAPTLLYMPGIDGVGLGLIRHHDRLAKMSEMSCLHIPVEDRTSFERLIEYVERTLKSESSRAPDRPVYLVGESVGACIALAVAVRNRAIDLGHLSISHSCSLSLSS